MEKYLSTRYTEIHFTARFIEDTEVVREKTSALRGGMGEMLLRAHCVSDRQCENCGFKDECIVQRTMYSKLENRPEFMHTGDSVGYIVHCTDTRKNFSAGDTLEFSLILFGKNIVYFSQYLNAFHALGMNGLGKNQSRFEIVEVSNLYRKPILDGNNVYMQNYRWQTIQDYVNHRKQQPTNKHGYLEGSLNKSDIIFDKLDLILETPLELKYQGDFIKDIDGAALQAGILRRLYILACFENVDIEERYNPETSFPDIVYQEAEKSESYRYSSRKDQHMKLQGIKGTARLENVTEEWLDLLLATEVIRIGKNTSFGFGKVRVK